jgi:hypothetical protein
MLVHLNFAKRRIAKQILIFSLKISWIFFLVRCYLRPALRPKPWIYVEAFAREHKQNIKKDPAFRRHFQAAAQFSLQYV